MQRIYIFQMWKELEVSVIYSVREREYVNGC